MQLSNREIQYSVLGVLAFGFIVWIGLRMSKWNNYLNSQERIITVATFYESCRSGGSKSISRAFKYFYKIDDKVYFESVIVDKIKKAEVGNGKVVQFVIVVSKVDPTIHCIIWNKKFNTNQHVGSSYNYKIDKASIQYNTMMIGLTPRGKLAPKEESELRKMNLIN